MRGGVRQWLLVLAATIGFAGSLSTVQVILSHHNWRIDLTPEKRFILSEHARNLLAGLDRDIEITAFLRSDDPRNGEIEDLLQRVHNVSHHVHYAVVDVNRNPAVARQYGVDDYGSLVVESGGRRKAFANPEEDLLMEAILEVTRPGRKVVYFVTGHAEQDLNDTDRHNGYSSVGTALQGERYDVRPLSLLGNGGVPADASVVVIAGPRKDLLTAELTRLSAYIERGGSVLIMLDPDAAPRVGAFLDRYGVKVENGVVVDSENRLFAGDYLTITIPGLSDRHPVSAALKAAPLFSKARAVSFSGTASDIKGIEFLLTSPTSWRTPDSEVLRTGTATFVGGRDQRGPIPVGVSLLVKTSPGPAAAPKATPPARLIILGDSTFANNFFLEYLGDKDLLVNSINWLADEQELVGQRPQARQPGVNQFFVSAQQGRLAFILGTIVEPAIVLVIGATIFLRRRWKG
jgi:ABC-type uncharacterized transport system involved in gliding motility auxiliary subunit